MNDYHKKYIKYKLKYNKLKKQKGGKKLGQGSHGTVYDVKCDDSNETLCYFINKKKVNKILIYEIDTGISYQIDNKEEFITKLNETESKIAKIFTSKEDFLNELKENFKIKNIFRTYEKDGISSYTTLEPLFNFKGKDIYSSEIQYKNNEIHYILYSTKCKGNIKDTKINLSKMIIDVLESIVILQEKNYMHNDIKLDNIVLCKDKYKLIDWGASNNYYINKRGTLLGTSPIRLYIMNSFLPKSIIYIRSLQKIGINYVNYPIFIKINKIINEEYDIVLAKIKDKEQLNEIYKKSFDIFMLGMTILHVLFLMKDEIKVENYLSLVIKFVSLTNPIKNAKEALEITNLHFTNLMEKIAYK